MLVSPRLILDLQGKTWLCGLCAARPAPHIVKHARATQTSTHRARKAHTLTELGKHTQKSANIRTTHKGKNNTTDGGGAEGAAPIGTVVGASAASAPLCVCGVVCGFLCERSFVWRRMCA